MAAPRSAVQEAPVIIPEGLSMHLTATGTDQRRALVLIPHDSSKPNGFRYHYKIRRSSWRRTSVLNWDPLDVIDHYESDLHTPALQFQP